jgi:hypothetical protein
MADLHTDMGAGWWAAPDGVNPNAPNGKSKATVPLPAWPNPNAGAVGQVASDLRIFVPQG